MDGFGGGWKGIGGEGGIRTPDSLTTMPDFESGAFNRALPPLRVLSTLIVAFASRRRIVFFAPNWLVSDLVFL